MFAGESSRDAIGGADEVPGALEIEHAVSELREIHRTSGLDRMLAIGELVLRRFYRDSAEAWRDRRKNKDASVRRIASHPECPVGKSTLCDAVGIVITVRALPRMGRFLHIGASHIALVATLPESARQDWLERAEEQRWSVVQLKAELKCDRRRAGDRRGRPRAAPGRRAVSAVATAVARADRTIQALAEVDTGDEMDCLERICDQLDDLAAQLRRRVAAERPLDSATRIASPPPARLVSVGAPLMAVGRSG